MSIDYNDIPTDIRQKGMCTHRSITVDGTEIEFSGGFTDSHTLSYQDILQGGGFGIETTRPSIQLYMIYEIEGKGSSAKKHPTTPIC